MAVHFRPMHSADIESIHAIEMAAYPFPWSAGNFADCLASGYLCEILLEEDTIQGYSILAAMVDEVHVLNCCVAPHAQGRGLGRQMMQHLIVGLPEMLGSGHGPLTHLLLEVRPSNAAAIHLYTDLGFCEIGRRRDYYPAADGREEAIVMRYPA